MYTSELKRCVNRSVGLRRSHSLSHSSPVPNKPYGFCRRKAPWKKKEKKKAVHICHCGHTSWPAEEKRQTRRDKLMWLHLSCHEDVVIMTSLTEFFSFLFFSFFLSFFFFPHLLMWRRMISCLICNVLCVVYPYINGATTVLKKLYFWFAKAPRGHSVWRGGTQTSSTYKCPGTERPVTMHVCIHLTERVVSRVILRPRPVTGWVMDN